MRQIQSHCQFWNISNCFFLWILEIFLKIKLWIFFFNIFDIFFFIYCSFAPIEDSTVLFFGKLHLLWIQQKNSQIAKHLLFFKKSWKFCKKIHRRLVVKEISWQRYVQVINKIIASAPISSIQNSFETSLIGAGKIFQRPLERHGKFFTASEWRWKSVHDLATLYDSRPSHFWSFYTNSVAR